MPKRIIGVSSRLITAAKEEFLEKGFTEAVIKDIASKADTSPRAIYTRFANKEDLFCSVVNSVVEEFFNMFHSDKDNFWNKDMGAINSSADYYINYLKFAYDNEDIFLLLLERSVGTRYENFTHMLAEEDIKYVMDKADDNFLDNSGKATELFVKQITYSFYDSLFIPLIKGYTLDEAKGYITIMVDFYNNGLSSLQR